MQGEERQVQQDELPEEPVQDDLLARIRIVGRLLGAQLVLLGVRLGGLGSTLFTRGGLPRSAALLPGGPPGSPPALFVGVRIPGPLGCQTRMMFLLKFNEQLGKTLAIRELAAARFTPRRSSASGRCSR